MNYTTIDHDARLRFGLTCNDYCVADKIYHLANNPKNDTRWCFAGRGIIGEMLGLSRQSVIKIIANLEEKGLVEIHPETKHLRTTNKWYENFTPCKESLHPPVKKVDSKVSKKFTPPCKESLHPSYNKSLEEELEEDLKNDRTREENFVLPDVDNDRLNLQNENLKKGIPPNSAPPPLSSHQLIDRYHQGMIGNKALIEAAQVKQKVPPEQYHEALGDFIIDKKAIDHVPKDEADFRKHFISWLKDWKRRKLENLNPPVTHGKQTYGYSEKPQLTERIQSGLEYFAQMRALHPSD